MSNIKKAIAGVVLGVLLPVASASAAVITLTTSYRGFNASNANGAASSFTGTDPTANPQNGAGFHRIRVSMSTTGAAAGEDVDNFGVDVNLGGGLTLARGWLANNPLVFPDPEDPTQFYTSWAQNEDTNASDLKGIAIRQDKAKAVERQMTEPGSPLGSPVSLGEFVVQWDGTTATSISPAFIQNLVQLFVGNENGTAATSRTATTTTGDPIATTGFVFTPSVVPEPASLSLLGFAALPLLRRRRKA